MPTIMLTESHKWLIRSPATPVEQSHHPRQRKNCSGSNGRLGLPARKRSQSIVAGLASLGNSRIWESE